MSCTAPATENASLQILFKCPTLAIVFGNATKPRVVLTLGKVQNPLRLTHKTTLQRPKVARAHVVILAFWLRNGLCATTAYTFSTSQLPKVVTRWCWCALHVLTWKCASRHNGVHFFDISTFKGGPNMWCFAHFDLEMCFPPQRHALFRHLNFQRWSEHVVFCAFWLGNVFRATTAYTFSTSQLPKVVLTCFFFGTWKCASRHNGVLFFISHLARWLRIRRFSEPTFRPSGATDHWKTVIRDFSTFSSNCIFFLLTLSLLWSSFFFPSLLWLFPPLLFHLSILSEVWHPNFLRISQVCQYQPALGLVQSSNPYLVQCAAPNCHVA